MAIYLGDSPNFKPLIPFSDTLPNERWGKQNAEKFLKLLSKFYKDANCKNFFAENQALYNEVSSRFLPIFDKMDISWYTKFFGKTPNEKFVLVNALGNGSNNYGPSIILKNNTREVYAIMGTWNVDNLGMADFKMKDYFPTLIHEYNHSFVNNLIKINEDQLRIDGERIYAVIGDQMQSQAYGNWETMMSEAMVRAVVIQYMKEHHFDQNEIVNETQDQLNKGFIWINDLVAELDKYEKQRTIYPTLESYMPKIIETYHTIAANIAVYKKQIEDQRPKVISINEFQNNEQKVNSELSLITINFDKPLLAKGVSINYGEKGKNYFPKIINTKYSDDKKSIQIEVKLQKNTEYQFVLTGLAFMSADRVPINDYGVEFHTE